jgi:hypothetical protein
MALADARNPTHNIVGIKYYIEKNIRYLITISTWWPPASKRSRIAEFFDFERKVERSPLWLATRAIASSLRPLPSPAGTDDLDFQIADFLA